MPCHHEGMAVRPGQDARPLFDAIEQPRAHEYVAEQIRRQIGLGILAPGEALPAERELTRLFGVGRVTIQLAIGLLEAERLIETRRGRNGGSFVLAPYDHQAGLDRRVLEVAESADLIREAIDYRLVVEPAAARLAAKARTKTKLAEISAIAEHTAKAGNDAEFMREDTAFHLAIARSTGNRFLVDAVEQTRLNLNSLLALLPESKAWHEVSNKEHDRIVAALADRDGESAEAQMNEHVARTARSMHSLLKSLTAKPALRTSRRR